MQFYLIGRRDDHLAHFSSGFRLFAACNFIKPINKLKRCSWMHGNWLQLQHFVGHLKWIESQQIAYAFTLLHFCLRRISMIDLFNYKPSFGATSIGATVCRARQTQYFVQKLFLLFFFGWVFFLVS